MIAVVVFPSWLGVVRLALVLVFAGDGGTILKAEVVSLTTSVATTIPTGIVATVAIGTVPVVAIVATGAPISFLETVAVSILVGAPIKIYRAHPRLISTSTLSPVDLTPVIAIVLAALMTSAV
jgi:hypothetical protein